jgi:hypothetical protein
LQKVPLLHKSYITSQVLGDNEEAFLIFKGFIDLDDLRMIKGGKNAILADDILRIFDEFFFDSLDSPYEIGVILHFRLVDSCKGSSSNNLSKYHHTSWIS